MGTDYGNVFQQPMAEGGGMTKAKKPVKRTKAGTSKRSAEQRRMDFVEAYLSNGGNATEAALAAGFSPHTAARQGGRMVKDVRVLSVLDKRRDEVFDNLKITTERILLERARLAFYDPRKFLDKDGEPIPLHLLDDDTAAVICGIKISQTGGGDVPVTTIKEYKVADKNASLTSLEKQRGMYEADNNQSRPVTKVVMVPPKRNADD